MVETIQKDTFNQTSTISFTPKGTGVVICQAKNSQGQSEARASLIVNDLDDELIVWSDNELPISAGDSVSIMCGAAAHKYATDLKWLKDGVEVISSDSMYSIIHNDCCHKCLLLIQRFFYQVLK